MEFATNVWEELDDLDDGIRGKRLERVRGETLAAAVWELEPGASVDYHLHHGTKELLVVLRGRPTLRTHEGERELREGDVVAFARGRDGAHGTVNRTDEPVRYLMVAEHGPLDVIEYPDRGTLGIYGRTASLSGDPLAAEVPAPPG
ncbi:MAG: cupin domain-containing protein [Actinomycetota bacterium]|nr:cupin domain-containing protein [Actinomycetota bacterium]